MLGSSRRIVARILKVEIHAGSAKSDELSPTHAMFGACKLFLESGLISLMFRSVFSPTLASKWYLTEKSAYQTCARILIKKLLIIPASNDSHGQPGRIDLSKTLRPDLFKSPIPAARFFVFSFLSPISSTQSPSALS